MRRLCVLVVLGLGCGPWFPASGVAQRPLDERPAAAGEWGYRPDEGTKSAVTPPSFSWRPQRGIAAWQLECVQQTGGDFAYRQDVSGLNVHCPAEVFPAGDYQWRYRGMTDQGEPTVWSRWRKFTIPADATPLPMPTRDDLLSRIPGNHPRLFVRPEDMPRLRELATGSMQAQYARLVADCDRVLKSPPPTAEPPKYPPGTVTNSDPWREIWWGNRTYTIKALNDAATLAFTRLLGGKEEYGQLARRILMDCARWDPKGATGYRYNDEAGMPYAYYFVRTYTFVYDLLSEEERTECRRVMKIRGDEMYRHLCPRHLWQPYSSHSNRAWHFLGEVGVAMLGEVEGADDWVWFAMNVFYNTYPVWSDDDGGWHEGFGYWRSYIGRFTWWADTMRSAMQIDAYQKPYFSTIGYYPMYLLPPGKVGGGFGDLNANGRAGQSVPLVSQLATQARNGHWQWYVEQLGGPRAESGYVGFVRGALPPVTPVPPDDLPMSRVFLGTGQAMLNTSLRDATQSVQVVFKSSPFGTQSHGYEANNAFLLWAYGQRLLIRSGYRDSYGSDHHRNWMWSTRSVNDITVDGHGQLRRSAAAQGRITFFQTTPAVDVVVGEAGGTYRDAIDLPSRLQRFTRSVLFVKPDLVVVYDQLRAPEPVSFEYWLHATQRFEVLDQQRIDLQVKDVKCAIGLWAPADLQFAQTDQYDPNPRPRITLREWHLTATTPVKQQQLEFVATYRPYRAAGAPPAAPEFQSVDGGYVLTARTGAGQTTILLPRDDQATVRTGGLETRGKILIRQQSAAGATETMVVQ